MSKRFRIFYTKNLFFLFYIITFTKHFHQFIYYTHFFIKIIFFLTFSIIFHLPPPNPQSLCLSLSPNPQTLRLSLPLTHKVFASHPSKSLHFFFFFWQFESYKEERRWRSLISNPSSLSLILRSLKSLSPLGLYLILILGLGYGFPVNGLILS